MDRVLRSGKIVHGEEENMEEELTHKLIKTKSKKKIGILKKGSINSEKFVICKMGKFDNDYDIVGKLGEGSFGTVYKVRHKLLKIDRALKMIGKKKQSKAACESIAEIQILKKLDHSNILKIYEFYEAKDSYFIVTDIFNGGQLFDEIIEEEKIDEVTTARIIKEILLTLNYIHSQGIAHRDIKPQNILIKDIKTNHLKIKLIDWGLGMKIRNEKSGRFCGTPEYAAPEVYKGIYTVKCDMWSLGVLAFIMLTGQMPFRGKNTQDTMCIAQKGIINFKRRDLTPLSTNAKAFVLSLIQKDPSKRSSAMEALDHPWIKEFSEKKQEPQTLKSTLERLKQFNIKNRFGVAVVNFMNNHFSSNEEKEKLDDIFKYLDKNGDGVLSAQQLMEGYTQLYGKVVGEKVAEEIFAKLDVNNNGTLEYSQFIAFALQRKKEEEKLRLLQAFKHFDINKDGLISYKQIGKILEFSVEDIPEDELRQIMSDFDENGDNEIDFQEFMKCISSIEKKVSEKRKDQENHQEVNEQKTEQKALSASNEKLKRKKRE